MQKQSQMREKEKSVKATEFVVTRTFAGKKALREIMLDLICSAYARETAKKIA